MKKVLPVLFIVLTIPLFGQVDSTDQKWIYSAVAGININQIAMSNWAPGGDNAISWTFVSNAKADYKFLPWIIKNTFKLQYGRTKLGGNDYRTNDNEVFLENVLSYNVGWVVDPFLSNSVRTYVSTGYDYQKEPFIKTADFFDPGYITQSIGFTYNKSKAITSRIGLGFQETITSLYRQYSDDPETIYELESFKLDTGIESVTNSEITLDENLLFTIMLRLFSRFDQLDVWDVRWDNTITAKVNKYISVNIYVLTVYEKKQSPKTQLKEALQLGITYTIF